MKRKYLIIGVVALVVIAVISLIILLSKNKKGNDNEEEKGSVSQLVCKSEKGSITITYSDKRITSYAQDQIPFDLKEQNDHAKEIGLKQYIEEFTLWFEINYQGECTNYE